MPDENDINSKQVYRISLDYIKNSYQLIYCLKLISYKHITQTWPETVCIVYLVFNIVYIELNGKNTSASAAAVRIKINVKCKRRQRAQKHTRVYSHTHISEESANGKFAALQVRIRCLAIHQLYNRF